jgi:ATP-binding cassette subfamily C (CFTR/MRP) protein 1
MSSNRTSLVYSLDSFGPTIPKGFDFTLLFQDSVLSILPSAMLLLIIPFRIWSLRGKPRKVHRSPIYENKLVRCECLFWRPVSLINAVHLLIPLQLFLVVFALMQTALLVLYALKPVLRTRATLAAAVLTFIDALGLCLLSHAEHLYSIRPSAIINIYLLITLLFDVARARTLWLDGATGSVAAVFSSTIGIKVMVLVIEAIEKRGILLDRYRHSSPEVTSGIYSRKSSMFGMLFSYLAHSTSGPYSESKALYLNPKLAHLAILTQYIAL